MLKCRLVYEYKSKRRGFNMNEAKPVYKRVLDLVVRETEFEKNTSKKIKRQS